MVTKCSICGKDHPPALTYYKVKIERHFVNLNAIRAKVGLAMQLGSMKLAEIMGPQEELSIVVEEREIVLCEECAAMKMFSEILEKSREDEAAT